MEELIWSYIHFLGFTHRELFLLHEIDTRADKHLEGICHGIFELKMVESRKQTVRATLQETPLENYLEKLKKTGARIVLFTHPEFPEAFHHIPNRPFYLSVLGVLRDMPFLSIVGSRQCTPYGHALVKHFTPTLVQAGYGIVS